MAAFVTHTPEGALCTVCCPQVLVFLHQPHPLQLVRADEEPVRGQRPGMGGWPDRAAELQYQGHRQVGALGVPIPLLRFLFHVRLVYAGPHAVSEALNYPLSRGTAFMPSSAAGAGAAFPSARCCFVIPAIGTNNKGPSSL